MKTKTIVHHMLTATMVKPTSTITLILLLLIATETCNFYRFTDGAKRRIHVDDDLDDVVDDEEDDDWKEWGKKKSSARKTDLPPPPDFSKLNMAEMQSEMLKYQTGPVFGFVKLRLVGSRRTPDKVSEIAMKWTKIAQTGGVEVKFMGVDISTVMFTMEKGQDAIELKDFILGQEDAYEVKLGDQIFRRPGDPPFDQVFGEFQERKNQADKKEDNKHDEL